MELVGIIGIINFILTLLFFYMGYEVAGYVCLIVYSAANFCIIYVVGKIFSCDITIEDTNKKK